MGKALKPVRYIWCFFYDECKGIVICYELQMNIITEFEHCGCCTLPKCFLESDKMRTVAFISVPRWLKIQATDTFCSLGVRL